MAAASAAVARDAQKKKAAKLEKEAKKEAARQRRPSEFQQGQEGEPGTLRPSEIPVDELRKLGGKLRQSLIILQKPQHVEGEPLDGSCLGERKLPYQDKVLEFYQNKYIVIFVALCIMGNFVVNIIEKEIDPDPNNLKYESFWTYADITFNIIFIFELWANMWSYGGPVREFWRSGWNVFDTIIVLVGFLTMVNALGPPLDKLKLMRAFRVFRLFKRIPSLNLIVVALLKSVTPVFYAFVVMFIFFCIYSILAVELFRDFGEEGFYLTTNPFNQSDVNIVPADTARGFTHGLEYYGTFMRALFTLFQVMTGESWSEAVARPLLFGLHQNNSFVVGFYFTSFIILMQMVMVNVVVAVLLDNFSPDEGEEDEDEEDEDEGAPYLEAVPPAAAPEVAPEPQMIEMTSTPAASLETVEAKLEAKLDTILQSLAEVKAEMAAMRQESKPFQANQI